MLPHHCRPKYIHNHLPLIKIFMLFRFGLLCENVPFRINLSCLDFSLQVKIIICQACTLHTVRVSNLEPVLPQNSSGTNDFHDVNRSWMPMFFCQCEKMVKYSDSVYCAAIESAAPRKNKWVVSLQFEFNMLKEKDYVQWNNKKTINRYLSFAFSSQLYETATTVNSEVQFTFSLKRTGS